MIEIKFMEIAEIIRKEKLETEEMIFVVESYIKERKGVDVKIKIDESHQIFIMKDLNLLNHAYNNACAYYFEQERNNG